MNSREMNIFFFQTEDGIRYIGVTGVQTCALPIWAVTVWAVASHDRARPAARSGRQIGEWGTSVIAPRNPKTEIGRGSCRERVQISVVAESLKKKHTLLSSLPQISIILSISPYLPY